MLNSSNVFRIENARKMKLILKERFIRVFLTFMDEQQFFKVIFFFFVCGTNHIYVLHQTAIGKSFFILQQLIGSDSWRSNEIITFRFGSLSY